MRDGSVFLKDVKGTIVNASHGCKILYTQKNNVMFFTDTQSGFESW